MDYVDFIVHVFSPEKRAFYGLERLRKSAKSLSVDDLNAELKALIASTRAKIPSAAKSAGQGCCQEGRRPQGRRCQGPAKKSLPAKKTAAKATRLPPKPTKTAAKEASKTETKAAAKTAD